MGALTILERPTETTSTRMVMGLSGWLDGGEVSTATIEYLARTCEAKPVASIAPEDFYIYGVPGPMELSALFRPHTKIEEGLVQAFDEPKNEIRFSADRRLLFFEGREPNLRWKEYGDCVIEFATEYKVTMIVFVGSVSGLMPHTRKPFFYTSISDESLAELVEKCGLQPANYEGPSSFSTYLVKRAAERGIGMVTAVAGIPAYVQGRNEKGIAAAARKINKLLEEDIDLAELEARSEQFENSLNAVVEKRPDLAEHIRKLEEAYDSQVPSETDGELREWFEKQDIRLDM